MTAQQPFTDYLRSLAAEAGEIRRTVETLFSTLRPHQFNWKPAPEAWSVGQCIDHLIATNRAYMPSIEKSLGRALKTHAKDVYRPGLLGRFLISVMQPDAALKVRTPKQFTPSHSDLSSSLFAEFADHQRRLIDLLHRADGVDLNRTSVASPSAGLLRFRLGDMFAILLIHERRHIAQARRVVETDGFPG